MHAIEWDFLNVIISKDDAMVYGINFSFISYNNILLYIITQNVFAWKINIFCNVYIDSMIILLLWIPLPW